MPERRAASVAARVIAEIAAWAALCVLFLAAYVGWAGAPARSIVPHLRIVLDLVVLLAAVRIGIASLPLPLCLRRFASAALLVVAFAALLATDVACIVGVRSWGRVATWDMVASYLPQVPALLRILGLPGWAVAALVAGGIACLVLATAVVARVLEWPTRLAIARRPLAMLAGIAVLAIAALDLYAYVVLPPIQQQEPLSLVAFPEQGAAPMESQGLDAAASARRDEKEATVRAAYRPNAQADKRNVIVIVADALRADHMGVYGYRRDTTPFLSRAVAAGTARVAPAARATCSESLCGLLSLASSRYVHQFSRRMLRYTEVLAMHGYWVGLILGGDHENFYGMREQYGAVDSYFDASRAGGRYVNDDNVVLDELDKLPRWSGRPTMLQLHLMSSHMLGTRDEQSSAFVPATNYFFPANRLVDGRPAVAAINYYDNGVRQADSVVEKVVSRLREKGYLESALIVITADHGDALGEHGLWGHQRGIYDEMIRVPFVVLDFGAGEREPLRATAWPSQVDIAPTVLHELRIPIPSSWSGQPLQGTAMSDFIYFQQGDAWGLLDRRDPRRPWKYWEVRAAAERFAFDLAADPEERSNLAASVPPALLDAWQLQMLPVRAQSVGSPQHER